MSKIIYLKQEVSIGEIIDFEGMKVTVNSELINNNPELFEVKEEVPEYVKYLGEGPWSIFKTNEIYKTSTDFISKNANYRCWVNADGSSGQVIYPEEEIYFSHSSKEEFERQELLKEAKRRFPIGSRFKDILPNNPEKGIHTVEEYHINDLVNEMNICAKNSKNTKANNVYIYWDGKWATKLEPILTTEDGKEMYDGDDVYFVCNDYNIVTLKNINIATDVILKGKFFADKSKAEQWVKDNKPKTLEDYEDELLTYKTPLYVELKEKEPKLYWLKVMKIIAEDLNKGNKGEYFIVWEQDKFEPWMRCDSDKYSEPLFDTSENDQKAIDIMGNKLNLKFDND